MGATLLDAHGLATTALFALFGYRLRRGPQALPREIAVETHNIVAPRACVVRRAGTALKEVLMNHFVQEDTPIGNETCVGAGIVQSYQGGPAVSMTACKRKAPSVRLCVSEDDGDRFQNSSKVRSIEFKPRVGCSNAFLSPGRREETAHV